MSATAQHKKMTPVTIAARKAKNGDAPVVCLTCYTHYMAQIMDSMVDVMLVGDSLGMVVYGCGSTMETTLDMMIAHGKAVTRGADKSCVVVDMPFGTYQESPQLAYRNAARIMAETGCDAVKVEGGVEMADTIDFLVQRGIPVMAHIGLKTAISANARRVCGSRQKHKSARDAMMADAKAVERAGAFSVVLECLMAEIADDITAALDIPTIGIGASVACDGQILVTEDMLSLTSGRKPKFVKPFGNARDEIAHAVKKYADEVRAKTFPSEDYMYK